MKDSTPQNWIVPLLVVPLLAVIASFAVRLVVDAPTFIEEGTAVIRTTTSNTTASPTDAPALPTITPTPAPGLSRQTALPLQTVNELPNWEFSVLEQIRGTQAEQMIAEANMFNHPVPEGHEFLLLKIRLQNRLRSSEEERLSFAITGNQQRVYYGFSYSVVEPEPQLNDTLAGGETSEGWIEFVIAEGEQELVLIAEDQSDYDEPLRFYALTEGANPLYNFERGFYEVSSAGINKEEALTVGQTAVTPNWQIHLGEVLRGQQALQFIEKIDGYAPDLEAGMEHLFVYVELRYIGLPLADPEGDYIITSTLFDFEWNDTYYDRSYAGFEQFDFPPTSLYPEGMVSGWIAFEIPTEAKGYLMFGGTGYGSSVEDTRYWRIDE